MNDLLAVFLASIVPAWGFMPLGVFSLLIAFLAFPVAVFAVVGGIKYRRNPIGLFAPPFIGLFVGLLSKLICPFAVALGLIGVRFRLSGGGWDSGPSQDGEGSRNFCIHGTMPFGFRWTETIDKRLPGDFHERALAEWFDRGERWCSGFGKYLASWYWLGTRNTAMTLSTRLGHQASGYLAEVDGYQVLPSGTWRYCKSFGPIKFVFGYIVWGVDLPGGGKSYPAGPSYSIKRS